MLRYTGTNNYVYLSYTCADCFDIVALLELIVDNYRYWFGSDVDEGEELPEESVERIENCHVLLFFATESSVRAQHCRDEIALALAHGKEILVVLNGGAELTEELSAMLGSAQIIRTENIDGLYKVMETEAIKSCRIDEEERHRIEFFEQFLPDIVMCDIDDDDDDEEEMEPEPEVIADDFFDDEFISDPAELYEIGRKYRSEGEYIRSIDYYRKAAVLGHAAAQFEMGEYCYQSSMLSFGVDFSYVEWYSLSAMQGYSYAEFRMGECFRDGRGVSRNYETAAYWFRKAAAQGDKTAKKELKAMKRRGLI